ncbi:energy-coupling factor transporter ATPase [Paenibacillus selenitireducens]|uniref:energy-coupling factor transporter ATPase n=1 Tax=Paenibacillus selenitireducens TaxID=1324314 RepID=UPI00099891FF|nr:energy-coupling factor transporter ATPase [Paenibacillus selenitireducens]
MPIVFSEVSHAYPTDPSYLALDRIQFQIQEGQFVGIIGPTGSGKSTLLQHFNAILRPTSGRVQILDFQITPGEKIHDVKKLRQRIGLVFQFPEQQLFAETVEQDLCFGPLNFGATTDEAKALAVSALELVGLGTDLLDRSPFQLSGGQMRKVAIASVLAMNPDVLVLDEPTATLDPKSRADFLELLHKLCKQQNKTVIVVTHRLDEVLPYTDHLLVMHEGRIGFEGSNMELFQQAEMLKKCKMAIPKPFQILRTCELITHQAVALSTPNERATFSIEWVAHQIDRMMTAWYTSVEGEVSHAAKVHLRQSD